MVAAGLVCAVATDTPRSLPRLVTLEETMTNTLERLQALRRMSDNLQVYWAFTIAIDLLLGLDTTDDEDRFEAEVEQ